jgi:hypothetical protein
VQDKNGDASIYSGGTDAMERFDTWRPLEER